MNQINGYKTYIVAGVTAIAAIFLFATGSIEQAQMLQLLSVALTGAGLRHAIK